MKLLKGYVKSLLHGISPRRRDIQNLSEFEKGLTELNSKKDSIQKEYNHFIETFKSQVITVSSQIQKGNTESFLKDNLKFLESKRSKIEKGYIEDLRDCIVEISELQENYSQFRDSFLKAHELKYKNYLKHSLNRNRDSMPQIQDSDIDSFLIHFSGKSKSAKVSKVKMKLKDLKPTQKEFNEDKIVAGLGNKNWKDRNYIISKDNHLLDGHHSWGSGLEESEDEEVNCYKVNLPIKELLRRSNLLKISTKKDVQDNFVKSLFDDFITSDEELVFVLDQPDLVISQPGYSKLIKGEKIGEEDIIKGSIFDIVLNKDTFEKDIRFIQKGESEHCSIFYTSMIHENDIEKGRKAQVGEVRIWGDQKVVKHADGWVILSDSGKHKVELPGGKRIDAEIHHVEHAKEHLSKEEDGIIDVTNNTPEKIPTEKEVVEHPKFGKGIVVKRENLGKDNETVTVDFEQIGEKTLISKFAKITPLNGQIANVSETTEEKKEENKPVKEKKQSSEKPSVTTDIKIVARSDKAFKISRDDKETWIPKGWADEVEGDYIKSVKSRFSKRVDSAFLDASEKQPNISSTKFSVSKETEKAVLLDMKLKLPDGTEKNIQTWFPKSKVVINGKNIEINSDFYIEKQKEINDKYSVMKINNPSLSTEKAIGINISVYENLSEQTVRRTMWFPKSQLQTEGTNAYLIPKWLYNKAVEEVYSSVKTGGWQFSSDNVFELEGLDQFEKQTPEIVKAQLSDIQKSIDFEIEKGIDNSEVTKNRIYSDIIIQDKQGKILFLKRSSNDDFQPSKFCLPGGKVESGETPEDAVKREVLEETGIELKTVTFIKTVKNTKSDGESNYFYSDYDDSTIVLDQSEHDNFVWMDRTQMLDLDMLLDLKKRVKTMFE